jgi:hypothetical protein
MIYRLNDDHTLTEFSDRYVEYITTRYVPDGSLIVSTNIFDYSHGNLQITQADRTIINNHLGHVFFDSSPNITNSTHQYQNILQINLAVPFYILTSEFTYYKNSHPNTYIKFFPFWAIWASDPHSISGKFKNYNFSEYPKKYKLSCLNGMEWQHRKWIYLQLANKSYFDDIVFSYGNRYEKNPQDFTNELQLSVDETNEFLKLPTNVTFIDDDETTGIDVTTNHPAYLETYINLVTETSINKNMSLLSEKTFKPIVVGQLFILVAATGSIQFLRDIGIDTFDDIIDHSYDTIVNSRLRLETVIAQVDHLMTLDLAQIYTQIKPRLLRNSEYVQSVEFRQQFSLTFDK